MKIRPDTPEPRPPILFYKDQIFHLERRPNGVFLSLLVRSEPLGKDKHIEATDAGVFVNGEEVLKPNGQPITGKVTALRRALNYDKVVGGAVKQLAKLVGTVEDD